MRPQPPLSPEPLRRLPDPYEWPGMNPFGFGLFAAVGLYALVALPFALVGGAVRIIGAVVAGVVAFVWWLGLFVRDG